MVNLNISFSPETLEMLDRNIEQLQQAFTRAAREMAVNMDSSQRFMTGFRLPIPTEVLLSYDYQSSAGRQWQLKKRR